MNEDRQKPMPYKTGFNNAGNKSPKLKHLFRAGMILAAIVVIVFVAPRLIPFPESFYGYGFYAENSQANALEWSNQPAQHVETSTCNTCHEGRFTAWQQSAHSPVACETCHGPGRSHIEEGTPLSIDTSREFCGLCHASVIARRGDFPQVDVNEHGGQTECVTCHDPHQPAVNAAARIPHTLEGRDDCLLCHGSGGLKPFPQNHAGRTSGECLDCHKSQ